MTNRVKVELTDGVAFISETVMAQDPNWQEHWRAFLAARARAMYGKRRTSGEG